jgi:hypothetical protein
VTAAPFAERPADDSPSDPSSARPDFDTAPTRPPIDDWSTATKVVLVAFLVVALALVAFGIYALGVSP